MAVDTLARAIAAGKVPVDAYEMAVAGGYTGTKEEFEADMGNSGTNATNAANSAAAAAASETAALAAATNFAPAYSSSATYAVGDYVLYEGGLYKCNTAITTAEAWTAAHWTAVKVGPEITDLNTQINSALTPEDYSNPINPAIVKGDYISTANGKKGSNTPTRARTNIIDGYNKIISLSFISDTYEYRLFYYASNGDLTSGAGYLGHTDFMVGYVKLPTTAVKIAMDFRRKDNANLSDADCTAIAALVQKYYPLIHDIDFYNDALTDSRQSYLPLQYGYFSNSLDAFKHDNNHPHDFAYCVYDAKAGDMITCASGKAFMLTQMNSDLVHQATLTPDWTTAYIFGADALVVITAKDLANANDFGDATALATSIILQSRAASKKEEDIRNDLFEDFCNISTRNSDLKNLFNPADCVNKKRINTTTGAADTENNTAWWATDYIPVTAGEKYTINFSYWSGGNYGMAFYDSSKVFVIGSQQSNFFGQSSAYAAKTNFSFTVPSGCAYCRFTINETVLREALVRMTHYIPDLVNPDGIPASEWIPYAGERITIGNKYCVGKYMNMTHSIPSSQGRSNQGGDSYGKYYFQFEDKAEYIHVYDLETKSFVQTITQTAVTGLHCNSISFGVEKYDSDDDFPLIYCASADNNNVIVYRITGSVGEWALSLVQTISWDSSATSGVYYPNIAIDPQNKWLIQAGYTLYSTDEIYNSEENSFRINVFKLPKLAEGSTITIADNTKLYSNVTPWKPYYQDAICRCGKMYQEYGNSYTDLYLTVYDVTTGTILSEIDLRQSAAATLLGEHPEPEGLFEYNGDLYIAGYKYGSAASAGNNVIIQMKFL